MSIAGTIDAPLELFGGLVTDIAAADLPPGVSPDCADVKFQIGAVTTRPGLLSVFAPLPGNPTINYLKTFSHPDLTRQLLAFDSAGTLWIELTPGTLSWLALQIAGVSAKSDTLFGREYMAFSDGQFGTDIPRQYDGTNFDRVSQVGPALPVGAPLMAVADIVANISAISCTANVVTVTTATPHGVVSGDSVVIAGVTDATFNGTFAISTIPDSTHVTYAQTHANASSSGGTLAPVGSIAAGVHQCVVIFVTRQGYLTRPSAPVSWTAAGGRRANITGIPTPALLPNIVARILAFTGAGGATYFYTTGTSGAPQMQIFDNTASSFVVDFSDNALLSGTSAQALFQRVELGECAGVIAYANRLFWWGERNRQNNWDNLSFDGGFGGVLNSVPNGWTPDPTFFAGGGPDSGAGNAIWGRAYLILGDGVTATRGLITQSAVTDYLGAPRLRSNTGYSVRARVRTIGALTQGTLHIALYSVLTGALPAGITVTAAQASSSSYTEFIAPVTYWFGLSTIQPDLVLRVYADGTPTNGAGFMIENIEIFPTAQPYNTSDVRASRANDPEAYDSVTGFLQIAENDGTAVRAAFKMRERLYFVKDDSLYQTEDDGLNEPSSWKVNEVSHSVGTLSVAGVDVGEDWAVILSRRGLYIFDGSEPVKISQEIDSLWKKINWKAGSTAWVKIDSQNSRIYCGVPLGNLTSPTTILVLDYRGLITASEIIKTPPVHFSSYSGKMITLGHGRKWAPWSIGANCCAIAWRPDNTFQVYLGNNQSPFFGDSPIYQLSDTQLYDSNPPRPINSYYTTYFFLSHVEEQQYQVRSHRKLFSYLSLFVEGAGTLALKAFTNSQGTLSLPFAQNQGFATQLPSLLLSSPAPRDLELPLNLLGERVAFQVSTNAAGSWFKLQRFIPSLLPDPWSLVRGN